MKWTVTQKWLDGATDVEDLLLLFEQVAFEEGWQPGNALRAVSHSARHLAVIASGTLAGGVQVVLPDHDGYLPFQAVWPDVRLPPVCRTAHITVLALAAPYRGRPSMFWSLCAELWRFLVAEGMDAVVLEATPHMFARYRRLGFPLEEIGSLRLHWNEECVLTSMDLRTVAGAMLMQARHSPIYRTLITHAGRPHSRRTCVMPAPLP